MGRTLAAFVVAASLLTLASSEAAAWECRAVGLSSSGYARAYDIVDAKLFALRQCERRSPLPEDEDQPDEPAVVREPNEN